MKMLVYNYSPKGRWIVVDIYRDAKRRCIYPPLFTDPEGDSCFSIYQIRWIKNCCFINGHNFFFWNFRETKRHFSLRSQNSEYPMIFQVTWANQNERKLLSTDLVNTKNLISIVQFLIICYIVFFNFNLYCIIFKFNQGKSPSFHSTCTISYYKFFLLNCNEPVSESHNL